MADPKLVLSVGLAIAAVYGLTLLGWFLIRFGDRRLGVVTTLLTPLCLLLIPAEYAAARSLTALVCVDASLKLADYGRQMTRSKRKPDLSDFCRFLVPFPHLAVVYGSFAANQNHSRRREFFRLLIGCGLLTLVVVVIKLCRHVEVLRENFLLDHTVKFPLFIIAVESLSQADCAIERLAGFDTAPIVHWSFLSQTPAEFWIRWNQRVHDWLYRNLFVPWGGLRTPVRGIFLVFLVSAVFHEVAFGIATSRWDGYQFAFFTLQIPAVLISPRLARVARSGVWGATIAHVFTVGWFYVTSMLFLHGRNRALPWFEFYASQPWLP